MDSLPNSEAWIVPLLDRLPDVRITVFGDFCLDVYWMLNTSSPEISIETGLALHRVEEQRYTLGGAGSVVANLAAMGAGTIRAVGVLGEDLFGTKLLELLTAAKVDSRAMLRDESVQTMVYAKPYSGDKEHSRIDFGGFNRYSAELVERALTALDHAFAVSDVVILNQQVPASLSSPEVIRRINVIIASHPDTVCVVDARHYAEHYAGAALKLNMHEAARILGEQQTEEYTVAQAHDFAVHIHAHTGKPTFLTRGEDGLLVTDVDGAVTEIPGLQVNGPTDAVGAGDAVMAGIGVALAAGETVAHAAELGNIAASITVQQLQCTGTASAQQIREAVCLAIVR